MHRGYGSLRSSPPRSNQCQCHLDGSSSVMSRAQVQLATSSLTMRCPSVQRLAAAITFPEKQVSQFHHGHAEGKKLRRTACSCAAAWRLRRQMPLAPPCRTLPRPACSKELAAVRWSGAKTRTIIKNIRGMPRSSADCARLLIPSQ